jgi:formylglycine-generating enzyme required for sulfatase activity
MKGLEIKSVDTGNDSQTVRLENVFIQLDIKSRGTREEKQLLDLQGREKDRRPSVLSALASYDRLVLLGDPGSGKSTLVQYLSYTLAQDILGNDGEPQTRLGPAATVLAKKIPVRVIVRDLALLYLEDTTVGAAVLSRHLKRVLHSNDMESVGSVLEKRLEDGHCLVLLDGLDEVAGEKRMAFIRDVIEAFIDRYPKNRYLATCRILSYEDEQRRLRLPVSEQPEQDRTEIASVTLAPFDDKQIDAFVTAWYTELERTRQIDPGQHDEYAKKLQRALQRPDLQELAPNPLLLTVMTLVHAHKGELPDARVLLYKECLDILLYRWEVTKLGGKESNPTLLNALETKGRKRVDLLDRLCTLAFDAKYQGDPDTDKESLQDIQEIDLRRALATLGKEDWNWADEVLETLRLRASVLIERTRGLFTFPHRTFQEYLAGVYITSQTDIWPTLEPLLHTLSYWRESILLAMGILVYEYNQADRVIQIVNELAPRREPESERDWQRIWLAGECLEVVQSDRLQERESRQDALHHVRHRLVSLLQAGALTPVERASAGTVLAKLGDPRFRRDFYGLPGEPLLGFVEIPEGEFVMGDDTDERANPAHDLRLPTFYIGRYPVTVGQYAFFVEDKPHTPEIADCLNAPANHPVVWISWHEALLYCRWLQDKLIDDHRTPEPLKTMLVDENAHLLVPSEAEWEKAARGTDERVYPWGNEITPEDANYDKTNIDTTSPVGCFPDGASPYGCLDMAGNVDEWTRSLWGKEFSNPDCRYPYQPGKKHENLKAGDEMLRVLRGGSFDLSANWVRCAARGGSGPGHRNWYNGFRVVLSPVDASVL